MVKLRLKRLGKKKQPFYRIVAIHSTLSRQGRALDVVGTYSPKHSSVTVNEANALHWLNHGAVMTETVEALFRSQGILARWKGKEGTARENALTKEKPKRRRKLAGTDSAPVAKEGPVEEVVDENSTNEVVETQPEENTEE